MLRTDTENLMDEALDGVDSSSGSTDTSARVLTPGVPLWDFPRIDARYTPVMKIGFGETFFDYK